MKIPFHTLVQGVAEPRPGPGELDLRSAGLALVDDYDGVLDGLGVE